MIQSLILSWKRRKLRSVLPELVDKTTRGKKGEHRFSSDTAAKIRWALEHDFDHWVRRSGGKDLAELWGKPGDSFLDNLHLSIGSFDAGHIWGRSFQGPSSMFIRHFRTSAHQERNGFASALAKGMLTVIRKRFPECRTVTVEGGGAQGPALEALFHSLGGQVVSFPESIQPCYQVTL